MARFVDVPADALMRELRTIGEAVTKRGGSFVEGVSGSEIVVDIFPPGARCQVRVFTSLARGATNARACGADAVRLIVCVAGAKGDRVSMHVLEEPEKILRTASSKLPEPERVRAFLARLRDRVRVAYGSAVRRPCCPSCGRAMATRKTRDKTRTFYGCVGYPACTGVLSKG